MFFVKILLLCVVFTQKPSSSELTNASENLFIENLQKLLDFCIFNPINQNLSKTEENLINYDVEGYLLGIFIAKGQLRNLKDNKPEIRTILNKLEVLEKILRNKNEGKKLEYKNQGKKPLNN